MRSAGTTIIVLNTGDEIIGGAGYVVGLAALTLAGTAGGGGSMQPPAVYQEYLFCLPVECHQFFIQLSDHPFHVPPENFRP